MVIVLRSSALFQFGAIRDVRYITGKGYAFVEYYAQQAADDVLAKLPEYESRGRRVSVVKAGEWRNEKKERCHFIIFHYLFLFVYVCSCACAEVDKFISEVVLFE